MGEDYYSLNRDELIEKLKSKDEQITQMSVNFDKWKDDFKNMFEKEQSDIHYRYSQLEKEFAEYKNKTQGLRGLEFENEHLKESIVAMAMYCFPGIANMDKKITDINEHLKFLEKRMR